MNMYEPGSDGVSQSVEETEAPVTPEEMKAHIKSLHTDHVMGLDDDMIDKLIFGVSCPAMEIELFVPDYFENIVLSRYVTEKPFDGTSHRIWTPYEVIETVLPELNLTEDSTFYDLGAGYGRLPLYAGIVTPAKCIGIEMVPERAQKAQQAKERLGLSNVDIITSNVLDVDFSDGDSFYMYSPFSNSTFKKVLNRLDQMAEQRKGSTKGPLTLVARDNLPMFDTLQNFQRDFQREKRLRPRKLLYGTPDIAIFRSTQ